MNGFYNALHYKITFHMRLLHFDYQLRWSSWVKQSILLCTSHTIHWFLGSWEQTNWEHVLYYRTRFAQKDYHQAH